MMSSSLDISSTEEASLVGKRKPGMLGNYVLDVLKGTMLIYLKKKPILKNVQQSMIIVHFNVILSSFPVFAKYLLTEIFVQTDYFYASG